MDRVIVKICGPKDPQGPYGWPSSVVQYSSSGQKPDMGPDDKDMTLVEYQEYCRLLDPVYKKWEHDKQHGIIDVEATPVKQEAVHEPDTHESFEQEVLKPKRAKKEKKE